jgi:isopentenyl-diphosphate delta-isomerase
LAEYEFDHVYVAEYDGKIDADKQEIRDFCFRSMPEIRSLVTKNPADFTAWFHIALPKIEQWWNEHYKEKVGS